MNKSFLLSSFLLALLTSPVMSQPPRENVASQLEQVTDPDFQRLSASFTVVAPALPEEIPFSRRMEAFLDLFAQEFASRFVASDVKEIEAHRVAWWQRDYLAIINSANARAFQVLAPLYRMSFNELATGGVEAYVTAIEQIETDMENRITAHHNELLKNLTSEGQTQVSSILNGQIATQLSESILPTFDLRGFATAYPGVMARQLMREASRFRDPPPEMEIREVRQGPVVMLGTFPKEEK